MSTRVLLWSFALLFATACFPQLEGAPCLSDLHCPDSQTCVEEACRKRCELPCEDGFVCGFRAGTPACMCPVDASRTIFLDSVAGSRASDAPFPTGIRTPASCRFSSAAEALGRAREIFEERAGTAVEVVSVADAPADAPRVYAAESWPLEIPAGITLRSEDGDPLRHALSFRANGDMVRLAGRLQGVSLRNESPGAPGRAIVVACQNGTAGLQDVVIEAADAGFTPWLSGVSVEGCRLEADALSVRGAQSAVTVEASPGAAFTRTELFENVVGLEVLGGSVSGELSVRSNGVGAHVAGGNLMASLSVRENDTGLLVTGGSATLVTPSEVTANADAGIALETGGSFVFEGSEDAGLSIGGNGVGLRSRGGSATLSWARFSTNVAGAVSIEESDGLARPHVFTHSVFESQEAVPLVRVLRLGGAGATGAGLLIEDSEFVGGTRSLELGPGPLKATIRANLLTGASEAGLHYTRAQGSEELIDANRIVSNGSGGLLEGGVVLGGSGGTLGFTGNVVAGNNQQQIVFLQGDWVLAATCAEASSVYCYASEGYGVYVSSGTANVTLYWPRSLPLSLNNDFNSGVSANSCGAVSDLTCP